MKHIWNHQLVEDPGETISGCLKRFFPLLQLPKPASLAVQSLNFIQIRSETLKFLRHLSQIVHHQILDYEAPFGISWNIYMVSNNYQFGKSNTNAYMISIYHSSRYIYTSCASCSFQRPIKAYTSQLKNLPKISLSCHTIFWPGTSQQRQVPSMTTKKKTWSRSSKRFQWLNLPVKHGKNIPVPQCNRVMWG